MRVIMVQRRAMVETSNLHRQTSGIELVSRITPNSRKDAVETNSRNIRRVILFETDKTVPQTFINYRTKRIKLCKIICIIEEKMAKS